MTSKVVIHPPVLFTIVNNLERRKPEDYDNSGIIVGKVSKGVIYLKYAYPVKYEVQNGVLQIDSESIRPLLDLHHRVHPGHVLVGWYTKKIDDPTYLINKYLPKDVQSLVFLRVFFSNFDLQIDTFISTTSGVPNHTFSVLFMPIPYEISTGNIESSLLSVINDETKEITELNADINNSVERTLNRLSRNVHDVLDHKNEVFLYNQQLTGVQQKLVLSNLKNLLSALGYYNMLYKKSQMPSREDLRSLEKLVKTMESYLIKFESLSVR